MTKQFDYRENVAALSKLMNLAKSFEERNDLVNKYIDDLFGAFKYNGHDVPIFDRYTIYGQYLFEMEGTTFVSPYFLYIRNPEEREKGMIGFTIDPDSIVGRALKTGVPQISSKQDPSYDNNPVEWSGENIGEYISTYPLFNKTRVYSAIQFLTNKIPDKNDLDFFEHISGVVFTPYVFNEMITVVIADRLHDLKGKMTDVSAFLFTANRCLENIYKKAADIDNKLFDSIKTDIGLATGILSEMPHICQRLTTDNVYTPILKQKTTLNIIARKTAEWLSSIKRPIEIDMAVRSYLAQEMPYQKLAEADIVNKVLKNFVRNSYDAVVEKGIKSLEIEITTYLNNDKIPTLHYKDNAGGMKQEMLEKMFISGESTKGSGRGIGMFAAARIIAMEKGHIRAASTEGEGTEFWIEIPVL